MPTHLDVLGRLHVMLGGFAVLTGTSLMILAGGTQVALAELMDAGLADLTSRPGAGVLMWCGVVLITGGAALVSTGRALARRRPASRRWAFALAVPNLLIVPFGTALSVYAFWVLLNDDARREFGRPLRSGRQGPSGT